jgi:hypothetical protein
LEPEGSATDAQNTAGANGKDAAGQPALPDLPSDETNPIVPTGSQ